jgi:hypothetical protein
MLEEAKREEVRDMVVKAYSTGALSEERLDAAMGLIAAATQESELAGLRAELAPILPARAEPAPVQLIRLSGAHLAKRGAWFRSESIRVEAERSNIFLDFRALRDFPGSSLVIDLAVEGCNIMMKFPKGTLIQEDIENRSSNIHATYRGENNLNLRVLVRGWAAGSNIRIKTRGRY